MMSQEARTPSASAVHTRYLLMPHEANPFGTAFGGVILAWMDMVAGMAAQQYCNREVVTAGMDSVQFREPIHVGDHVILKASVNYAGRTSMEVGVQVSRQEPLTGETTVTTTAHFTFVALGDDHQPTPVPPLLPETPDEKRRYENARVRVQARKELLRRMQ